MDRRVFLLMPFLGAVEDSGSGLDIEAWNVCVRQLNAVMDDLEEFLKMYAKDLENRHTINYLTIRKMDETGRDIGDFKKYWDKFANIVRRGY